MNTKKKHKNRPKPNPTAVAKVEAEVKEEKVGDVVPKSDVKGELAAEITAADTAVDIAEVVTPVVESVEAESETPKKPKRKGKKKNQDKENVEADTQEKLQEIIKSEVSTTEKQVTSEDDSKAKSEQEPSVEAACVTPSARKKKNKKKTQEQQPKAPENVCSPIVQEEKIEEILKVDSELKEVPPPKAEESKPDNKTKKKNKKKKRNDSEKSDRSEEVTCTSGFKQLLIEDDQPSEEAIIQVEGTQAMADILTMTTSENVILDDLGKSCDIKPTEEPSVIKNIDEDVVEAPKEEIKNRKKNKKEKKHPHVEQQLTPASEKEEKPEIKQVRDLIDPFKPQIVKEASPIPTPQALPEIKPDIELLKPIKPEAVREPSPKPKAKIAKPVEKKRKGQHEPATESLEKSSENLTVMKEEVKPQVRSTTPIGNVELKITEEEKIQDQTKIEPQDTCIRQVVETINVPETIAQDKKRKKSPKPSKSKERFKLNEELSSTEQSQVEQQHGVIKSDILKSHEEKTSSGVENVTFTLSDETFIPLQKSEKTVISREIDEVPPLLKITETDFSDSKAGKRKKKTPKFPVSTELTEPIEIKQLITPEVTESKEMPKTDAPPKMERVSESLAALSDIEIRSVKTDDSGSSCEATPDVHFIRSSSHQLLDTNNNMVIHEVRNVEETKPNEPFIKPIVEGSGATPSGTPDLVASGIQMTENKTTRKEEPTYLKSKMMEVNQDMEELRLSIERSLAEFTAMEKTEEKAEKAYESHRVECEKTFAGIEVPKLEEKLASEVQMTSPLDIAETPPVCPARKDNKGKSKSKKKGKPETTPAVSPTSSCATTSTDSKENTKDKQQKQEKTEQKTESTENKEKQQSGSSDKKSKQSDAIEQDSNIETQKTEVPTDSNILPKLEQTFSDSLEQLDFAPIDKFEDALTSSIDDVNKTFEMIVNDNAEEIQRILGANKPKIDITAPVDETDSKKETNKKDAKEIDITAPVDETDSKKETNKKDAKVNPVSQPKNFLGHNDIPAASNKTDYKKEKNKTPNERQAKVKIKDAMDVEAKKQSKESQTDIKRTNKMIDKSEKETFSRVKNDNEDYVYKYSFRKVFLQSACHICHKELAQTRVPCGYCNLVFYCGSKHKDEDWPQHQALCFAVSTIVHLKDQKHIYADAQNITGQDYRLLRMQMIVSCEKVLKRRLVPWEQEAILYPRMCGDVACREWRQTKLKDCEGCGQISYCIDQPNHLPKSHQRWCKSYHLYSKLVGYQQTRGRLEPKLPTKVMVDSHLAEKMNEVLAAMYEEKIDMNDIQYAALTQLATAPLTAAYCYQLCMNKMNCSNGVYKKSSFTIHVVGAELQFEADALNKWEVFFLHLHPDVEELRVVLISPVLNPGDLPLDLLGKIRLCENCRQNQRRVVFSFQDKKNYSEYRSSDDFVSPKLVCAFNPSIQRSSVYNGKDPWPNTINCIIKQKVPFIITGYTLTELRKDIARIKECSEIDFRVISEPVFNNFASVRPDRNFISDDEMPLLFKNYCVSVLYGC